MANNPRRASKDIEELENEFQKLSKNNKKRKNSADNKITTVLIICICLLSVAVIVGGILIFSMQGNRAIASDISIAGVSVQGMKADEATQLVTQEFTKLYGSKPVTITIEGKTVQITPDTANVRLDAEAAVQAAIDAGKNADAFDLSQYISFDRASVLEALQQTAASVDSTLVQSTYEVTGTAPADLLAIDENASQVLKVTKGTPGKKLDTDVLLSLLTEAYSNGNTEIEYSCPVSEPDAIDLEAISQEHCSQPVTAEFEEGTFKVLGGTYGYAFDAAKAASAIEAAEYGETLEFPFAWTKPEVTADDLNSQLFRDELATYTTRAGSQGGRDTNIELASAAIDGTILYPGDVFSYNEVVGERTPEKGYKPGATYIGGQTVMSYGGGICQVSTTLYYCTIVADLEVVERECHAYPSSYTPLSTDATVFWGGIDYKFRNNTEYPIRIDAYSDNGNVTISLYGTDTKDYYVEFESVHLATYPYDVVYEEMPADNEKGYKDGHVLTSPYTGYKSEGWAIKYSKETGEEIERVKVSTDVYSTRDKVVVKIVGGEEEEDPTEPEPTEPTPTDPEPTEPQPTEPDPTEPQPTEPQPTEPSSGSGPIELPPISG